MQHANKTRGAGPLGGSGLIAQWGASSLIASLQNGTISATTASATATINSVDASNSVVVFLGQDNPYAAGNAVYDGYTRLALTNATTVTYTRAHTDTSNLTVSFVVVEFLPGVLRGVQQGTVAMTSATSATATITSVNTAKSFVIYEGQTSSDSGTGASWNAQYNSTRIALTNATTVTATRRSQLAAETITVGFCVLELF